MIGDKIHSLGQQAMGHFFLAVTVGDEVAAQDMCATNVGTAILDEIADILRPWNPLLAKSQQLFQDNLDNHHRHRETSVVHLGDSGSRLGEMALQPDRSEVVHERCQDDVALRLEHRMFTVHPSHGLVAEEIVYNWLLDEPVDGLSVLVDREVRIQFVFHFVVVVGCWRPACGGSLGRRNRRLASV